MASNFPQKIESVPLAQKVEDRLPSLGKCQTLNNFDFDPTLSVDIYARKASYRGMLTYSILKWTCVFYGICLVIPAFKRWLTTVACESFNDATHAYACSSLGPRDLILLKTTPQLGNILNYYSVLFLVDKETDTLVPIESLPRFSSDRSRQLTLFGLNRIYLFTDKTAVEIFAKALLTPAVLFGLFSLWFWGRAGEFVVMGVYLFSLFIGIVLSIWEQFKTRALTRKNCEAGLDAIFENSQGEQLRAVNLVPGDIIVIHTPCVLPADGSIIRGKAMVDESMLSGESVPVPKTPAISSECTPSVNNIVCAGTKIVSMDAPLIIKIRATGSMTVRAKMLLCVAYPRSPSFKFSRDFKLLSVGTIFLVLFLMFVGWIASPIKVKQRFLTFPRLGLVDEYVWVRLSDILSMLIRVSQSFQYILWISQVKLAWFYQVDCRIQARLLPASVVNVAAFDKTGTLTEPHMILVQVIEDLDNYTPSNEKLHEPLSSLNIGTQMKTIMATCHTVYSINDKLYGDAMDVSAFEVSKAKLVPNGCELDDTQLSIVQTFFFCSERKRQTVIVDGTLVCTKGAPDRMKAILKHLPENYDDILEQLTRKGLRVITAAYRILDTQLQAKFQIETFQDRDLFERDMEFAGFLVFENPIRPESKATITTLKRARFKCLMITGDAPLTAVSVARQIGLANNDPLFWSERTKDGWRWKGVDTNETKPITEHVVNPVLTGDYISEHGVLMTASLFARTSPTQKAVIVQAFKAHGYCVSFCGDGANDCNAMRVSDAGIAISTADSAALAASFIAKRHDISTLIDVLRESRASMAKTMAMVFFHMLNTITYLSHIAFLLPSSTIGTSQMLVIQISCMAYSFSMALMKSTSKLSKHRPQTRILSKYGIAFFVVFGVLITTFHALVAYCFPQLPSTILSTPTLPLVSKYIRPTGYNIVTWLDYFWKKSVESSWYAIAQTKHLRCQRSTALFITSIVQLSVHAFICGRWDRFRTRFGIILYTLLLASSIVCVILIQFVFTENWGAMTFIMSKLELETLKTSKTRFIQILLAYVVVCSLTHLIYTRIVRTAHHPDKFLPKQLQSKVV